MENGTSTISQTVCYATIIFRFDGSASPVKITSYAAVLAKSAAAEAAGLSAADFALVHLSLMSPFLPSPHSFGLRHHADAPNVACELDMAIESELVNP